ncbi:cyclin-like protein interacting with PHO85 [Coemansia sp. RSA 2050]|nr:cyclin-like protein interacting with PHO85 [Coemansia sp. RSA 2050]KAJ2733079.1 cyclin-like protein interacting with PHO85 [Coemansia sp. BCRC 34962]
MAFNLATTPVLETVRLVSAYLDEVTGCSRALDLQAREPGVHERHTSLTLFHARSVPTIDLETYLSRIVKYCPCQSEVFLGLIVYMQQMIDRCARRRLPFTVDAFSIHRLVITGVAIASKWFSDVFFTNSRYAKVGGLSVAELNNLELQFLSIIDFDLGIQPEVLQAIGSDLFAGKLPWLANADIPYSATHIALHSARRPAHAIAPHSRHPPPATATLAQQQRALRHMSYPGPDGAYYSNSCAAMYDSYYDISSQLARKQQARPSHAAQPHLSSGSTLVSPSPRDSAITSMLQHELS